jgi:nitrogen PTS system EIIA component
MGILITSPFTGAVFVIARRTGMDGSRVMLDVKEVAKLLTVSEKTVYRWIAKNEIPAYRLGEGYRFNRVELLEWATANRIKVSYQIFDEALDAGSSMPSLSEAVNAGGIHYRIPGGDKSSVLRSIVDIIRLPDDIDKDFLLGALIARENLGTTAIGDGIAIPHVRNPIIFHVSKPILALCFLENPIDFNALDNKPVDTVFTIVTHTVRSHLHILSRLSYALHQPHIRGIINGSSSRQDILDALAGFEETLKPTTQGT